jgi:hypothetical protein
LYLAKTDVTDAALENVKPLKKLGELWLEGTKVTLSGLKGLQKALPNCVVHHPLLPESVPPALLGVPDHLTSDRG